MRIKNQLLWDRGLVNNQDPYGSAVYRYAHRWAEAMEHEMNLGNSLPDIAKRLSHEADTEGITGFMYGCSVSILAKCWEHGEALRQWHNLNTQLQHEGEEANHKGAVLNPALLGLEPEK